MTLHYSRTRMDAPSPVKDANCTVRTRPATAGNVRDDLVPGGTQFYDSVTSEPLGGNARRRPSTARASLGGVHLPTGTHHPHSRFTAVARMSSMRLFPAGHENTERSILPASAMEQYQEMLVEADNEVEEMMKLERCASLGGVLRLILNFFRLFLTPLACKQTCPLGAGVKEKRV